MCSADLVDSYAMALGAKNDFQCPHEVCTAALKAHFELDSKVQAALRARSRPPRPLERGDWVFVHWKNRMGKHWRGCPGVVIILAGASAWVFMFGDLWKVNTEKLIRASNEERHGIEAMESFLPELKEDLGRRARWHDFWDLTPEGIAKERRDGGARTMAPMAIVSAHRRLRRCSHRWRGLTRPRP